MDNYVMMNARSEGSKQLRLAARPCEWLLFLIRIILR